MNLTLYFRLIVTVLFQRQVNYKKRQSAIEDYNDVLFYCPRVIANDGFSVSLQIHNGHYCSSENGYRELGHTWKEVEFGFPSHNDEEFKEYAESPEDVCGSVGSIPVSVLETIFEKHGGIDWNKTISVEIFEQFTKIG